MHRHLQTNLYIAVQSFARIDKSLREVVELVYWSKNNPLLPFHQYQGFYDLEKVGSMKGEHNVSHIVWKTRKVRGMFNTHAMKNQFAHKEEVPLIEWNSLSHSNKTLMHRWKQQIRIKKKRTMRAMQKKKVLNDPPALFTDLEEKEFSLLEEWSVKQDKVIELEWEDNKKRREKRL